MENIELLNYIYSDAKMGRDTTTSLMKEIESKDNKIKDVVEDIINSYDDFTKKSESKLKMLNADLKDPSLFISISAEVGIKFKMLKDNSDSAIAEMLIRGLTMGELAMTKKIENYKKDSDKDILDLAKEFKNFQSNAIVKLKKYL